MRNGVEHGVRRAAQLNGESTMEMRERENLFRIGSEAQAALRQQRAHMLTEHHQLVLEGDAQEQIDLASNGFGTENASLAT